MVGQSNFFFLKKKKNQKGKYKIPVPSITDFRPARKESFKDYNSKKKTQPNFIIKFEPIKGKI